LFLYFFNFYHVSFVCCTKMRVMITIIATTATQITLLVSTLCTHIHQRLLAKYSIFMWISCLVETLPPPLPTPPYTHPPLHVTRCHHMNGQKKLRKKWDDGRLRGHQKHSFRCQYKLTLTKLFIRHNLSSSRSSKLCLVRHRIRTL
jgi:hypothetical protein